VGTGALSGWGACVNERMPQQVARLRMRVPRRLGSEDSCILYSLGVGEVCRCLSGIGPVTCAPAAWSTGASPECIALRSRVGQGGAVPAAQPGGEPAAPDEGRGAAAAAAADIARDAGGGGAAADDEALAGESCTLYVKNLAFATADAALAAHFDAAVSAAGGRIRSARASRRAPLGGAEAGLGDELRQLVSCACLHARREQGYGTVQAVTFFRVMASTHTLQCAPTTHSEWARSCCAAAVHAQTASGRLPRRRKGPDGKELSAGFGFVECSSEEVAKLALQQLQARGPERGAAPACVE